MKNKSTKLCTVKYNDYLICQTEGWIDDKLKVAYEDNFQDVTDLESKMKKLQKHQAFEAECVANTDRIEQIKEVGH